MSTTMDLDDKTHCSDENEDGVPSSRFSNLNVNAVEFVPSFLTRSPQPPSSINLPATNG